MTPAQALAVIEKAPAVALGKASSMAEQDVTLVTVQALEGVRVGLADEGSAVEHQGQESGTARPS